MVVAWLCYFATRTLNLDFTVGQVFSAEQAAVHGLLLEDNSSRHYEINHEM